MPEVLVPHPPGTATRFPIASMLPRALCEVMTSNRRGFSSRCTSTVVGGESPVRLIGSRTGGVVAG
ncbi:hypothetical protein ACFSJS_23365 [Streptomyces desertarenae]|uniref:Uncharacterized protein n=1 Tax=Streptomyces desertarenae TaxID=2666184 RepID=A0ABW4PT56_9ACTN